MLAVSLVVTNESRVSFAVHYARLPSLLAYDTDSKLRGMYNETVLMLSNGKNEDRRRYFRQKLELITAKRLLVAAATDSAHTLQDLLLNSALMDKSPFSWIQWTPMSELLLLWHISKTAMPLLSVCD